MSSHREAPEISQDPVADSTDLYAFVSPDDSSTVTLIANYIPLQEPAGGPNFYEFGDDVLYEIHIDNNGDGRSDISYQFRFNTELRDPGTFLYNTGPIQSLSSPNWNRRQFYSVTRVQNGKSHLLGKHLACPPCNIGPLSTPDYAKLASEAVHHVANEVRAFAGQRAEGFYVDLGAIFDLAILRPFAADHTTFGLPGVNLTSGPGVNATNHLNVHSIALQVPKTELVRHGAKGESDPRSVIGVWTTASRRAASIWDADRGETVHSGPFRQVSRLGNPLVNEVLIPLGKKDVWNTLPPSDDKLFASYIAHPGLAGLLNVLYPGVFPHLAKLSASGAPRADLEAILLTGLPAGVIKGFQNNTGPVLADMLRLNTAIPPTKSNPSILGVLGKDLAGYPNGRRVFDDVVTIELRAIAGLTYPLVHPAYKIDKAAGEISDFVPDPPALSSPYLKKFPYLGVPHSGYTTPS
jgi:hypothetical protein